MPYNWIDMIKLTDETEILDNNGVKIHDYISCEQGAGVGVDKNTHPELWEKLGGELASRFVDTSGDILILWGGVLPPDPLPPHTGVSTTDVLGVVGRFRSGGSTGDFEVLLDGDTGYNFVRQPKAGGTYTKKNNVLEYFTPTIPNTGDFGVFSMDVLPVAGDIQILRMGDLRVDIKMSSGSVIVTDGSSVYTASFTSGNHVVISITYSGAGEVFWAHVDGKYQGEVVIPLTWTVEVGQENLTGRVHEYYNVFMTTRNHIIYTNEDYVVTDYGNEVYSLGYTPYVPDMPRVTGSTAPWKVIADPS